MKIKILVLALVAVVSCKEKKKEAITEVEEMAPVQKFYVGTYTGGDSEGIYRYALHADGSLEQVAFSGASNNPSFLIKSPNGKFLVSVNEQNEEGTGYVESFAIKGDSLQSLSKRISDGAHPCHLSMNKDGFVVVSNYTGGNLGLLKLDNAGELSELLYTENHEGQGSGKNQDKPHAHSAWFYGDGNDLVSADLGTNELWFSRLDIESKKLVPASPQKLLFDDGAGPRHMVFHPNKKWLYVVNELNATVTRVVKNEKGVFEKKESVSTLPEGYNEDSFCADIHISLDGKFVYASNRGHNSIVIYGVDETTGELKTLGYEPTKGNWPRNFSLSPDGEFLIVANQESNNLVSFKRDVETGELTFVSEIEAPTPVCILF
ncbi:6-phosphogluconolactonase [Saonia flava]|uniref:6-phosphogluconolactonase n=1 Tax=Saonia flava TaxID=523696 RepID=A0A846QZN2_9FLAO|nr:lactonase family protein [Saonia flava]NJB72657.1 6-phosphogluconolactonase [Saonia flava]